MKFRFLFFLILLVSQITCTQQTLRPFVQYDGDNLILENFPAISEDGSHYIVISNKYSCCLDFGDILQKIRTSDEKVVKEIKVTSGEEDPQFTVEKKKVIHDEVNKLLDDRYISLTTIQKFELVSDKTQETSHVKTGLNNHIYVSEKFTLPKIEFPGYCCGDMEDEGHCMVDQTIQHLWIDFDSEMLLLESGFVHSVADGCDRGPFYKMISIE